MSEMCGRVLEGMIGIAPEGVYVPVSMYLPFLFCLGGGMALASRNDRASQGD